MSTHRNRRNNPEFESDSISLPDSLLHNSSCVGITTGDENSSIDEQSSLQPIKARKQLWSSVRQSNQIGGSSVKIPSSERPRKLKPSLGRNIIISIILGALTVPFFMYGFYAWRLHGLPTETRQNPNEFTMFSEFGKKLATAFPFIFSLVVGRTLKQIAAWRLEKGTSFGSLEQIMGSLTLGSTVATQFWMRRLSIATILFLCTWSLSPLGSQSSLQVLSIGQYAITSTTDVDFFNTDSSPGFAEADLYQIPSLTAMFASCLISPASISNSTRQDLWGNVKIPDVSRISNTLLNSTGWYNLPMESNLTFSSLLGIPLNNMPSQGNTTFSIESSYISVRCHENITAWKHNLVNYVDLDNITQHNFTYGPDNIYYTTTLPQSWAFSMALNGFHTNWPYGSVLDLINNTSTFEPRTLLFQSQEGDINAWCPITTTYVESSVKCVGISCAVIAIKPSQLHHPNSNLTNLGYFAAFNEFSKYLMGTSGANFHPMYGTGVELFIADPEMASQAGWISLSMQGLSADIIGTRLQQVINTFWYGSYDPVSMMGLLSNNHSSSEPPLCDTLEATNVVWQDRYICHFGWLLVLLLTSTVILVAAIAGCIFGLLVQGPDILGYCSTLLRDSPYIPSQNGGSFLDGSDRARELRNIRVRLVDVEPENEVGYIAIADDSSEGLVQGSLSKERWYR